MIRGASGMNVPVSARHPHQLRGQSPASARTSHARKLLGGKTTAEVMPSKSCQPSRITADHEVVVFMKHCGLQMYTARLLHAGFDQLEILRKIDDADMQDVGMPSYQVARLRKGLRELQQPQQVELQTTTRNPVSAFLEEHGLQQYAAVLLRSGFDEMDTLLEIEDFDLKDLGVPRGHIIKLKRHLREYQITASAGHVDLRAADAESGRVQSRSSQHHLEASSTMKGDVQKSWETIVELGTAVVGERIYRYFFEMVPQAMASFPVHVRRKYREWTADEIDEEGDLLNSAALRKLFGKVLNAIGCVVAGLQDSSKLVPLLTSLGRRHIGYAVSETWWPLLGKAVNMALSDILGNSFTSEVENAWNVVYGFASSIMIAGLREARAAATQIKIARETEDFDCSKSESSCVSTRSCITAGVSSENSVVEM